MQCFFFLVPFIDDADITVNLSREYVKCAHTESAIASLRLWINCVKNIHMYWRARKKYEHSIFYICYGAVVIYYFKYFPVIVSFCLPLSLWLP